LKNWLINNVIGKLLFKTIVSWIELIVFAVVAAVYIDEIKHDGRIDWSLSFKTVWFYLLIVISLFLFFYKRQVYIYEKVITQWNDIEFIKGYMLSECIPAYAKKFNRDLKEGKEINFIEFSKQLKGFLKK